MCMLGIWGLATHTFEEVFRYCSETTCGVRNDFEIWKMSSDLEKPIENETNWGDCDHFFFLLIGIKSPTFALIVNAKIYMTQT